MFRLRFYEFVYGLDYCWKQTIAEDDKETMPGHSIWPLLNYKPKIKKNNLSLRADKETPWMHPPFSGAYGSP